MNKKVFSIVLYVCFVMMLVNCAKKGAITGGPKDEEPPKFVKALPANFSTNFDAKEIRIYFDEYIKLKDAQKQILISPPMDPPPLITPIGTASRFIKIKFLDTLLKQTTYTINFGESVVDNNEENPYPFFKYVFSTGDQLDSLKLKGFVKDALHKETEDYISVMLYEMDSTYRDSVVYKKVPRYVASTLDSTSFSLDYLKKGNYKLVALKDKASNFTYQPKQDKIGFYQDTISLPVDTTVVHKIVLFKEVLDFDAKKPSQVSKHHILFGYEGVADSMNIKLRSSGLPEGFQSRILQDQKTDSLHYWFKPFVAETDSLVFEVSNQNNYKTRLMVRIKDQKKDSLTINKSSSNTLPLEKQYSLQANIPLEKINNSFITLIDKDSIAVPFTSTLDTLKNQALFQFEKTEENNYELQLLPEAITDFFGNTNDTLSYTIRTLKYSAYGKVFLSLENVESYPVIVQLTSQKGEIRAEKIIPEAMEVIVFENLDPDSYFLRVITDTNKNGQWDSGNFLKKIQPERVSHFPKGIEVRANWELKQTFTLE